VTRTRVKRVALRVMLPLVTESCARSEWTRYETYAHDAVVSIVVEGGAEGTARDTGPSLG
jgi:hypothetical protein